MSSKAVQTKPRYINDHNQRAAHKVENSIFLMLVNIDFKRRHAAILHTSGLKNSALNFGTTYGSEAHAFSRLVSADHQESKIESHCVFWI